MKTYTVTYNMTLSIEVQAGNVDEAERLADDELPSHCDVNCAVSCHRIATIERPLVLRPHSEG
jgi:hypothetical protein